MGSSLKQQPSDVRTFKGTTVFDWDAEPSDERPSQFVESSLHMGLNSTCRPGGVVPLEVRRARPPAKTSGGSSWLFALVLIVGIAGAGLYGLTRWLHG